MAKRTQSLMVFPWIGGLHTVTDPTLIQPGELTFADNIMLTQSNEKRRREGINYNLDDCVWVVTHKSINGISGLHDGVYSNYEIILTGTFTHTGIKVGDKINLRGSDDQLFNGDLAEVIYIDGTTLKYKFNTDRPAVAQTEETKIYWANKVIGGIDFWFGESVGKGQEFITVLDNGAVFKTLGGQRTRLDDIGTPWQLPLTMANLEAIENKVFIAIDGQNNPMKVYRYGESRVTDVPSYVRKPGGDNLIVNRASSGTTRTLTFSAAHGLTGPLKMTIIDSGLATYDGTYMVNTPTSTTITYTAVGSLTESVALTGASQFPVGIEAPYASVIRYHAGCLWANDKTAVDRLHYSGTSAFHWWGGDGFAGAMFIGEGDGDPEGITGISPTLKGTLFVGKRTKLYRLEKTWFNPDQATVSQVSNGIGFLSHQAVCGVDQDDVFFVSERGVHSLSTTNAYGDFSAAYISTPIQDVFTRHITPGRKKFIKAAYVPELNSVMFALSEDGQSSNNVVYLFNILLKAWYKWTNVQAETLIPANDADKKRIYLGTYRARLAQMQTATNVDRDFNDGLHQIISKIQTGKILVDQRPDTMKQFKSLRLIFRVNAQYRVTASVKIDNFSSQPLIFRGEDLAVPLGIMVLNEDVLGGSYITAPYSLPIDGIGRSIQLTIVQDDRDTSLAIQGFMIEYMETGPLTETRMGDDK